MQYIHDLSCKVEKRPGLVGKYVDGTNVFIGACVTRGPDWRYGNQDTRNPADAPVDARDYPSVGVVVRILGDWVTVRWLNGYSNSYKLSGIGGNGEHYLMFSDRYECFDVSKTKVEEEEVHEEPKKTFEGYTHIVTRMVSLRERKGGSVMLEYQDELIGNTRRVLGLGAVRTTVLQSVTRLNCKVGLPVTAGKSFVFSQNFDVEKLKGIAGDDAADGTLASGFVIPYGVIVQSDVIQGGWVWVCWFSMEDVIAYEATGEISNIVKDTNVDSFIINCYPIEGLSSLAVWPMPKRDEVQLERFVRETLRV